VTHPIASAALLVHQYDEAIAFVTTALRSRCRKRPTCKVATAGSVSAFAATAGASLRLAQADGSDQKACVGRQGGGRGINLFAHR